MICTRESVKSMRERNVDDGYIIHVGRYIQSIFGFEINEQLCANVCINVRVHVHVCMCLQFIYMYWVSIALCYDKFSTRICCFVIGQCGWSHWPDFPRVQHVLHVEAHGASHHRGASSRTQAAQLKHQALRMFITFYTSFCEYHPCVNIERNLKSVWATKLCNKEIIKLLSLTYWPAEEYVNLQISDILRVE